MRSAEYEFYLKLSETTVQNNCLSVTSYYGNFTTHVARLASSRCPEGMLGTLLQMLPHSVPRDQRHLMTSPSSSNTGIRIIVVQPKGNLKMIKVNVDPYWFGFHFQGKLTRSQKNCIPLEMLEMTGYNVPTRLKS